MAEAYICSLSKVQRHAEICKEINNLYERKNHDYGDSFHQTFVEEGMAMARIRLGDKFSRFKTLSRGGEQKVNDESIRDTLIDLANYGKEGFGGEITVIRPSTFAKTDSTYHIWKRSCEHAEVAYFDLLNEGCTPQEARSVLPNSLKTEVVMTADLREWRHFCRMRCPVAAHPDMRVVANMLLTLLKQTYPVFFEDIEV